MKYEQLIDGIGSTVKNKEKFKLACCDCGLVHDVAIVAPKVRKGVELGFAVARKAACPVISSGSKATALAHFEYPPGDGLALNQNENETHETN